jgi:hypothetical protein
MAHILAHDPARQLPLYPQGFAAGRDVGLRIGLETIVAELAREDDRAAVAQATTDASTISAKVHEYASGCLTRVAVVVADRFRQGS